MWIVVLALICLPGNPLAFIHLPCSQSLSTKTKSSAHAVAVGRLDSRPGVEGRHFPTGHAQAIHGQTQDVAAFTCLMLSLHCSRLSMSKRVSIPNMNCKPDVAADATNGLNLQSVAEMIKSGKVSNVIAMVGAGISVSAGIPDFRTPGTGLYDNLQEYGLPTPQAIFDLEYFLENPKPFYRLCGELWPGRHKPTATHHLLCLLHSKGVLRRCYSQNIDSLETQAGLPGDALIAAHGNFDSASVLNRSSSSKGMVPIEKVRQAALEGMDAWDTLNAEYGGLVKPDIVFFGESLPGRFIENYAQDFRKCDLLLVIGTSLAVTPFASLIAMVEPGTPRLLINRERVGEGGWAFFGCPAGPFDFAGNSLDGFCEGDCDDAAHALVGLLGWQEDFDQIRRESA